MSFVPTTSPLHDTRSAIFAEFDMDMASRRNSKSPDYDFEIDDLAPAEWRKRGGIDEIFWMSSCNSLHLRSGNHMET